MTTLDDWLAWSRELEEIYMQELQRSSYGDPIAFVNWTYHRFAAGQSPQWIRERIRESHEWRAKHGGDNAPAPKPIVLNGLIKVTNAFMDGPFHPRFYSYWSNAWVSERGVAWVFAGHVDGVARLFGVDLQDGTVDRFGQMLPRQNGTTEGWSWDAHGWIYLLHGAELLRCNPFTNEERVVFSIADTHPGCRLWQSHSSEDGLTHCATIERITSDGPYERIGTVVHRDGVQKFYPAIGVLDESQITQDWLVIKETINGRLDNRIINLDTGVERILRDADGAVGHSDCWNGLLVGEDDQQGACVLIDLETLQSRVLFRTWRMGHIAARGGRYLLSNETHVSLVDPVTGDISLNVPHGASNQNDYDSQVRANLDPSGRVACFMSDAQGSRDVYLLVL